MKLSMEQKFIKKLIAIIRINLENEQFGVNELASEIGLSRSQLHRKLQDINGKSTTQFIREYRLQKAMKMLKRNRFTASEIAYKVGFSSPSYFNSCFNDFYGYPPGEVKFKKTMKAPKVSVLKTMVSIIPVLILIGFIVYNKKFDKPTLDPSEIEKYIVVLPFINDSPK